MNTSRAFSIFGIMAWILIGVEASPAQTTAKSTAQDGIYTSAQAARGQALYFDNCVACHGNELQGGEDSPPLAGNAFNNHWGGLPVSALLNYINTQMPLGQPGSLGANADADIAAYVLSVNHFPAGGGELPADTKQLGNVTINKR